MAKWTTWKLQKKLTAVIEKLLQIYVRSYITLMQFQVQLAVKKRRMRESGMQLRSSQKLFSKVLLSIDRCRQASESQAIVTQSYGTWLQHVA
jgi:hypothetical protein